MKKTKTQRGITLIALIITIIVLLILAVVTIGAVKENGIIEHAQTAKDKYEVAASEEKKSLVEMELMLGADGLRNEYPLSLQLGPNTSDGEIIANENLVLLYGKLLNKYNTNYALCTGSDGNPEVVDNKEYDKLTLTTAIKAMNKLYEIYNPVIQQHEDVNIRENFWNRLANGVVTVEGYNVEMATLNLAFSFSKYNPTLSDSSGTLIVENKYYIMANASSMVADQESVAQLDLLYPGGHFPINEITGTTTSDFSLLLNMEEGKLVKITEENASTITMFEVDENDNVIPTTNYIGKIVYVVPNDEDKLVGFLCHNDLVFNLETGDIIYIDDNGTSNKVFL